MLLSSQPLGCTQLSSQFTSVRVTDIRYLQCDGLHRELTDTISMMPFTTSTVVFTKQCDSPYNPFGRRFG